jgi:hypothetical protein
METIDDLDRIWYGLPRLGIRRGSVSAHNFDTGAGIQSRRKCTGCPIQQQVHDHSPFQIHQDCGVRFAAEEGKIVDSQYVGCDCRDVCLIRRNSMSGLVGTAR